MTEATGETAVPTGETEAGGTAAAEIVVAVIDRIRSLPGSTPEIGHRAAERARRLLRAMPPAAWFGVVMALLFLAFGAALLLEPSVGRGGR